MARRQLVPISRQDQPERTRRPTWSVGTGEYGPIHTHFLCLQPRLLRLLAASFAQIHQGQGYDAEQGDDCEQAMRCVQLQLFGTQAGLQGFKESQSANGWRIAGPIPGLG